MTRNHSPAGHGIPTLPPLYTVMSEVGGWPLDRTAAIPKSHRITFGQRLDNLALDVLVFLPPVL